MSNAIASQGGLLRKGERRLITELAAGDVAALERWFCEHQAGVYAFAYFRLGRDPDLAADATQTTFVQALERLSDFDPQRGEMGVWLCTLARNVIRRLLAQHRRSAQLDSAQLDSVADRNAELRQAWRHIDSQPVPEAILQRQQTRELVATTLAALPPQYQAVLEARYFDGQPLEAIAARRETTLDGAKSMLRRARAAFRECFVALAGIDVLDR